VSTFEAVGTLQGADVRTRTFHFEPDQGEDFRGSFLDAINESHPVGLPKRYNVTVRKTVKIRFSTEEEKVSYHLERLDDI
jgi:hypothetical protein